MASHSISIGCVSPTPHADARALADRRDVSADPSVDDEIAASQRDWACMADTENLPNLPRFLREWAAGQAERDAMRAQCHAEFDAIRDRALARMWGEA